MPEPATLALLAVAVALAGLCQGALGFGFGIVSMGLVSLLVGVKDAVALVAPLAAVMNVLLFLRFRRAFVPRPALALYGGVLVGIPFGVLAHQQAPAAQLMLALGVAVLAYLGQSALRPRGAPPLGRTAGALLGLLAGFLGGAINTTGPPSAIWVSTQPWESDRVRATLLGAFVLVSSVQIPLYVATGVVNGDSARSAAVALVPAVAGGLLGARIGDRVPAAQFRRLVRGGLGVLGVVYTVRGVLGLLGG